MYHITQLLLLGRPPIASTLLFSFHKQVLCLLVQRKHPAHAWFPCSEDEYRQMLEVFSTHERRLDHPCWDSNWCGEAGRGKKNLSGVKKRCCSSGKAQHVATRNSSPALQWRLPMVLDEGVLARCGPGISEPLEGFLLRCRPPSKGWANLPFSLLPDWKKPLHDWVVAARTSPKSSKGCLH